MDDTETALPHPTSPEGRRSPITKDVMIHKKVRRIQRCLSLCIFIWRRNIARHLTSCTLMDQLADHPKSVRKGRASCPQGVAVFYAVAKPVCRRMVQPPRQPSTALHNNISSMG
jgi:hypothetical protein